MSAKVISRVMHTYMQEILARIELAGDMPVSIFCDANTQQFLKESTPPATLKNVTFMPPEDAANYDPVSPVLIIATHTDRWEALKIHTQLRRPKERGWIVALAMTDRRLTNHPIGWENTGLMYDGMFRIAAEYAKSLHGGDYAEFGVFDGNTFCKAYHALHESCRTFFAFDSFAGIVGSRKEEQTTFIDGQYSCNVATFRQNMEMASVDLGRVKEIDGPFQLTLKANPVTHGVREIAVAHIDTDVYEPAKLALDYLTPVLKQGALLLFDDYDQMAASNAMGERRALKEWLEENPHISVEPYREYAIFGRSFIVHVEALGMSSATNT